jgi:predicted NBD/HSP70 family sugar kinase/mannose-6-phosphate isomerase class I
MDKDLILGVDIGGSHVSTALVRIADGEIQEESFCKEPVDALQSSAVIFDQWVKAFAFTLSKASSSHIKGVGISMPGPFDYSNGVSLIRGVNKYDDLYGLNIKEVLKKKLGFESDLPIYFENDAVCFGLGESLTGAAACCKKVIAITLGTGLGATFLAEGKIQKEGYGVPPEGYLYHTPFKEGIAEDYLSTAWLVGRFNALSAKQMREAKEIYELALNENDSIAIDVFRTFGQNLGACLAPWIKQFDAECLIIGGNLAKASAFFLPELKLVFKQNCLTPMIQIAEETELSAIVGAAALVQRSRGGETAVEATPSWRKTKQSLMPVAATGITETKGEYNMYPFTSLGAQKIFSGYDSLARWIIAQKVVLIDGYVGVDWAVVQKRLDEVFKKEELRVQWVDTAAFLRTEGEIDAMVAPYLGEADSVWGRKTDLSLKDFYNHEQLHQVQRDASCDVSILIGVGAGLSSWEAPVVYIDLPKNELQHRTAAGSIFNLGKTNPEAPAAMYKRFYFVDWEVLNQYKRQLLSRIAVVADGQWRDEITWVKQPDLRRGLELLGKNAIRVRPWFAPGAWGGQWLKSHIKDLNKEEVNYAWSFELIVPENGLVLESDGHLLEVAFDWLMLQEAEAVLGKDAARFGSEFPIRFDFLDTIDGGNLSIQCHPRPDYIQEQFGETITQDETYYIVACQQDAKVYLGFQDDIEPAVFRAELEQSLEKKVPVAIEKYVQAHPAHQHDLFLIPHGTVHSSGAGNLVLEISATPYIFTFKMYDWLRLDLNGEPRPINIDHAFRNLNFERKGERVKEELISRPQVLEKGLDWQVVHLPTHPDHFYDVHRLEFSESMTVKTRGGCHVLMLVEGTSIVVHTGAEKQRYNFAETFVIPAAVEQYQLINEGKGMVKVIKAFIK